MFTWTFRHRFMSEAPRFAWGGAAPAVSDAAVRLSIATEISPVDAEAIWTGLGYDVALAVITYAKATNLDPMTLARASKEWNR